MIWAAAASPLSSVSSVGRHAMLKTSHPQTMQGRLSGTPSHYQPRVPWQGNRAGASPTASQQSSPSKSISAHASPPPGPCPTCLVLWPKRSSCLIPALNHSFTLRVRKETAHCQISYLEGNLTTFIEALSGSLDCPRQSL